MPVEYSPVTTIAPRMPATSIVNWVGARMTFVGAIDPSVSLVATAIRSEIPTDRAAVTPSDHHVERRVRILIASPRRRRVKLRP